MFGFRTEGPQPSSFVIGFDRIAWARWVQYTVSNDVQPYLDRRNTINVAGVVNDGLLHYGVSEDQLLGSITLDIESDLVIPKSHPQASQTNGAQLHLDDMPRDEFLLLPFTRQVGVVLPFEIREDTRHNIVFSAQVIDAADSTDMFRMTLKV